MLIRDVFRLRSKMSDSDRILMDPIKKWRQYNRFPFKLVVHTCVFVLIIIQIFVVVDQFTDYYRGMDSTFTHYFLPEEYQSGLFTINDAVDFIERTVKTYYSLNSTSPEVLYPVSIHGELAPVYMEVIRYPKRNISLENREVVTELFELTKKAPLGPLANLDNYQLNQYFFSLVRIRQFFKIEGFAISDFAAIPFIWNVSLYLEDASGMIETSIKTEKFIGHTTQDFYFSQSGWLNLFIIIFACTSTGLAIKALISAYGIYRRAQRKFSQIPPDRLLVYCKNQMIKPRLSWNEVPFSVKLDFFGIWHILSLAGDIVLVIGSSMGLAQDFGRGTAYADISRMLLGIGTVVVCSNMMKYLEYQPKFATLILTLKYSFSNNIRFLLSVVPMFLGFALCGLVCFSPYSLRFVNLTNTLITLFALLNGDDIHATFNVLNDFYPFPVFAQIYLYSFVVLFITAILNIFIFIIEDAYHAGKLTVLRNLDPAKLMEIIQGEESLFLHETKDIDIYSLFQILESEQNYLRDYSFSHAMGIQDALDEEKVELIDNKQSEPITNSIDLVDLVMKKQKEFVANIENAMRVEREKFLQELLNDVASVKFQQ